MPLMGFANLTQKLGEGILTNSQIAFDRVLQVDFYVDWFNGTDATVGESEYPVKVIYAVDDLNDKGEIFSRKYEHTKKYGGLYQIIQELEDLHDEVRYD